MKTEILPTHTAALFAIAVERACALLKQGEVVALPTETVYGLAANAWNPASVSRIFAIKGRPAHNPVIVHVAGLAMARECACQWPAEADRLAAAFWPGPLTMVLPKSEKIGPAITAGGDTVGLRWPSHPFIQAVIRSCGFPLAAPSANLSNQISPTNAAHVLKDLDGLIPLVIDGGQCQVGIESTVIDLSQNQPRLLRPGMIDEDSLRAVLGGEELNPPIDSSKPSPVLRSPGLLVKHYSPQARLVLRHWKNEEELAALLVSFNVDRQHIHIIAYRVVPLRQEFGRVSVIPEDAEAYARALYGELHQCDEHGARLIVVETPPPGAAWKGIRDRLQRASG